MNAAPRFAPRLLHLEDHPSEADLVGQVIREEWPDSFIKVVASETDLNEAITTVRFDLVLSNYSSPGLGGLAALVRVQTPSLPFIFLAGHNGEDVALGAIELGPRDIVLRDGTHQLVPAVRQALGEPPVPAKAAQNQARPRPEFKPGNGETVLVIDDEKFIGEMIRAFLERVGYRTLLAMSGEEGIELFRTHRAEVQVVMTDMLMPGLPCAALVGALRAVNPGVKVVLMSGMRAPEGDADVAALGYSGFLQKPMTGTEIVRAVEYVLGGGKWT
jgi:DNA-binding NarL/FixJ family response regulator